MLINNQFYIFTYAGSKPLNLMETPEEILDNPELLAEYSTFIKSVDTIYASQTINGKIPVFWTRRSSVLDPLNNSSVSYLPHPDSTLTELSSKEAYYVIVRDVDVLPFPVPMAGESVMGFVNNNIAPVVSGLNHILLTSNSGNSINLQPTISKLQPFQSYQYQYKGISANWPVTISPISGIISPSTETIGLSSVLSFCATSGACCNCIIDPSIIAGSIPNKCPSFNETTLYSNIELEIKPISFSGLSIKSNPITAECIDCLPRVKISLNNSEPFINLENIDMVPSGSRIGAGGTIEISGIKYGSTVDISGIISNLEPTQNYTYEYVGIGSNWPAMFITPISGIITNYSADKDYILASKITFCPTTGLCPSYDSSVIDYTSDPKFIESFYTSFILKITPNTCTEPYYMFQGNSSVYSSPLTIYCNDCL